MWPLLVTSLLIWSLMMQRLQFLWRAGRLAPGMAADVASAYRQGGRAACERELGGKPGALASVLRELFCASGLPPTRARLNELVSTAQALVPGRRDYLRVLVTIAPLLGLLGTVVGMVETFTVLETMGTSEPRAISSGISQALLTTQAGLLIALPGFFGRTWLEKWERRLRMELERAKLVLSRVLE